MHFDDDMPVATESGGIIWNGELDIEEIEDVIATGGMTIGAVVSMGEPYVVMAFFQLCEDHGEERTPLFGIHGDSIDDIIFMLERAQRQIDNWKAEG